MRPVSDIAARFPAHDDPSWAGRAQVTFIIPAFNAERTIARPLLSLAAQSVQAWRAVVVDDGSRRAEFEATRQAACGDSRVRILRQDHRGQGAARNRGLAAATTPWVVFLDADDDLAPDFLRHMLAMARAADENTAVFCGCLRLTAEG
ncbi:MAG TPA: glycosyltransferase family A protein, partial [Caulobacteraceae bacterium]